MSAGNGIFSCVDLFSVCKEKAVDEEESEVAVGGSIVVNSARRVNKLSFYIFCWSFELSEDIAMRET